jgi:hypothetical protein
MKSGEGNFAAYERLGMRVVAALLLLEALSVYFLWTLNPVGPGAESTFALYLAADLVSFAMISYVYRVLKRDDKIGRAPLLAGCFFILVLLLLGFVL